MRAEEIKGLMEAYSHVYETPEVLSEEVVEDVEQLDEQGGRAARPSNPALSQNPIAKFIRGELGQNRNTGSSSPRNRPGGGTTSATRPKIGSLPPSAKQVTQYPQGVSTGVGGGNAGASKPSPAAAKPAPKPAATSAAPKPAATSAAPKPAATSAAPKPSTPTSPVKPAGSAMDQWAKANPKLAAAKAERDRTRGTSATTNPLMKDMKSSMPAPKSPAPSTAKTGFDLAKKGVNLAAGVDIFDLVKGHLLDEGYADSEEGAMVIMVNMSEEWRETIIMELTGGKGHPGYKAGSKDHGALEDHPAVKKGGVLTPRHGDHLGDLDDDDDEEDDLEAGLKDTARKKRENVRKPLRDKVKAVRKAMTKEEMELDEAQRARENPEGHDKEEKRKYEPVRGERTPMPPRGDKRREDFEKWYAKQMGR